MSGMMISVGVGGRAERDVVLFDRILEVCSCGRCAQRLIRRVRIVAEHRERGRVGLIESGERCACCEHVVIRRLVDQRCLRHWIQMRNFFHCIFLCFFIF